LLLHEILDLRASDSAGRLAVVSDGGRTVTFGGLRDRVHRLARGLEKITAPGARIAILAGNCQEYVECYYGVPLAGRTLVPLNTRLHPRELADICADAGVSVLIFQDRFAAPAQAISSSLPSLTAAYALGPAGAPAAYEDLLSSDAAALARGPVVSEQDLAWIVYTSGTTGRPKGAMLTQENIVTATLNSATRWGAARTSGPLLLPWPMFHVAGYAILVHHVGGLPVVLAPKFDAAGFLELIEAHRVAEITIAPTMLNMLLSDQRSMATDLSSLSRVFYGSSPMPPELLRQAMQRLPGADFWTGFGMTELGGMITFLSPDDHRRAQSRPELLSSAGRPAGLGTVRLLDDSGQEVPAGTVGEITARGRQVSIGYWAGDHRPANPAADCWFRTGDLAYADDDGYLFIVDRAKDMIITGGENVYSAEVERVLYQHPAVSECAVVGLPEPRWGEVIVACVQLRDGQQVSEAEIIGHCRKFLAGYKTPRHVLFRSTMPLGASGKILKRELRQQVQDMMRAGPGTERSA
jgi:acyl-CoA synthetase (AMP-forming)/AMP-acid ligase II